MNDMKSAAETVVKSCMNINSDERVLVITDEPCRTIGEKLWEAAGETGAEALLTEIKPRKNHGEEPPEPLSGMMKNVEAVLAPTSRSLSHTRARQQASKTGKVRIATLPGITEDIAVRTLNADYNDTAARSRELAGMLTDAGEVHLATPSGTDITFGIEGVDGYADTGLVHNGGDFSNLPAGEAYLAPAAGQTEGVFTVDGAMAGIGKTEEDPIFLKVEEGFVTEISGAKSAVELKETLEPYGKEGKNIAELGIGTNDRAKISGNVLEDEKVMGTVHIALGNNVSMGGNVDVEIHLDGILKDPTVEVDGKPVMENGELLL